MPVVLIGDLPEDIYRKLKARAAANRRSLAGEALALLEGALAEPVAKPSLEDIKAIRVNPHRPITSEFIRKAIREGRS